MIQKKVENKRVNPRRNLYYYLQVIDIDADNKLGRIADLTTGGMMLISDKQFEIGSVVKARIILDNNLFDMLFSDLDITFTTQWSKPDAKPGHFANGLKFVDLNDKDLRTIEQIIQKIGFNG
ncbi:MAG: PilZ domain-containing protein [Chitinispirillales bacterium]|jgi:hypothetical protein|nr:PilZ domain-containing protein [Chitinispirillales bacterium]